MPYKSELHSTIFSFQQSYPIRNPLRLPVFIPLALSSVMMMRWRRMVMNCGRRMRRMRMVFCVVVPLYCWMRVVALVAVTAAASMMMIAVVLVFRFSSLFLHFIENSMRNVLIVQIVSSNRRRMKGGRRRYWSCFRMPIIVRFLSWATRMTMMMTNMTMMMRIFGLIRRGSMIGMSRSRRMILGSMSIFPSGIRMVIMV